MNMKLHSSVLFYLFFIFLFIFFKFYFIFKLYIIVLVFFFFLIFFLNLIYFSLLLAKLDICSCTQASSSFGDYSVTVLHRLLLVMAPLVTEQGL